MNNSTFDTGAITAVPCRIEKNPNCGGEDNACMVAEARGEHCRCTGQCAYAVHIPIQGGSVD